jgi:RNA polymerase sigma-70 factor (ECF subfamily)
MGPATHGGDLGAPLPADRFVEPMPDARLFGVTDPAERVVLVVTGRRPLTDRDPRRASS